MPDKTPLDAPVPAESSSAAGLSDLDSEHMKEQAKAIVDSVAGIQTAKPVSEEFLFLAAMKRIPFLVSLLNSVGYLKSADDVGLDLSGLVSSSQMLQGFQFGSLALSAVDFVKIPLIYLAAFLLGEKLPPFNLSRAAKWLYSAVGLGLGIAALVLPGAFPFIITVGAVLGVVVGAMSLGQLSLDRATTSDQLKAVQVDIEEARILQTKIITKKEEFDNAINNTSNTNITKPKRESQANRILIDLYSLQFKFDRFKLQDLLNQEAQYEEKLKKMTDPTRVVDKSVGVVLATLGLAGAITLFIVPPVGLILLAASSLLGGAYLLGRIATPWVKRWGDWFKAKLNPEQSSAHELEKEETKAPELSEKLDPRHSPEVLVETMVHPSPENQAVVDEVLADAKKLQTTNPRPISHASLTPETPIVSSRGDVDSGLNDAPNQDIKQTFVEYKKSNSKAEVLVKVEVKDKSVSHDEEDAEGEGEGEGIGKSKGT
ncbi:MAG: hypothetical protein A3F41_00960 [Coxiella sp. RIFCSPHIGHO2_12_FULL_44_14]|nr:MAG: hypothetical protein A3F41_00960 [Coxiella sp. RIFCSPHIGHO2_12_FULL_44_14]